MATTSIWSVKGWLGKVVIYVENPDKTENPAIYKAAEPDTANTQGLGDVIKYAMREDKTSDEAAVLQRFVSGVNCLPATARDEMLSVKRRYGKEHGVVAYHGYQSFAPGEATPEMAHEIGVKLAQALWGERFQVVVATHLDKEHHLHNHFVVNTVSFVDGKRYNRTKGDYRQMQQESDRLCREYGLSVIANPQHGRSKQYGEWRAEQEGRPTWRSIVKQAVDEAIACAMTERQFFEALRKQGYEIKLGKDISIRPPGKERFVRLTRNFGEDYSLESINRRILTQRHPRKPKPKPADKMVYRLMGSLQTFKKLTGLRALYYQYLYKMGVLPKHRLSNKQIYFLYREDIIKLDQISKQARLLSVNKIDTAEQLLSYKSSLQSELIAQSAQRRKLRNKSRTVKDEAALLPIKAQIKTLSGRIGVLRKEVMLCDGISARSGIMREKMRTEAAQVSERKERSDHEPRRGSSRTNR